MAVSSGWLESDEATENVIFRKLSIYLFSTTILGYLCMYVLYICCMQYYYLAVPVIPECVQCMHWDLKEVNFDDFNMVSHSRLKIKTLYCILGSFRSIFKFSLLIKVSFHSKMFI